MATLVMLLIRAITIPSEGAGAANVMVPVEDLPPMKY